METGEAVIARANHYVTYPARFQLVAAMNPCKCGMAGEPGHVCKRGPRCAADYQARVSGPLLDRIDLHVEVEPVSAADLIAPAQAEASDAVAARVAAARDRQAERYGPDGPRTNAEANGAALEANATPDPAGAELLAQAAAHLRLTARGYTRVLRVARTIADLAGSAEVRRVHVAEALSYRRQPPRA